MSSVSRTIIAATLLLVGTAASAQTPKVTASTWGAAQPLEETLEWMICDSQAVVHATIESGSGDRITFKVQESIKGELARGSIVSVEKKPAFQQNRFTPGQAVLLFLLENRSAESQRFPLRLRGGRGGFVLDGTEPVFVMNLNVVTQPQEIIAAAKEAAAYCSSARDYALLPCAAPAFQYLLFPQDQRLEALAKKWATGKSIQDRVTAMRALEAFKSDANIALAMQTLDDTRSLSPRNAGKWQVGYYNARAAADDLLTKWKVRHRNLPDSGPIYIYQPATFSRAALLWTITGLAALAFAMLIWRKTIVVRWTSALIAVAAIAGLALLWRHSNWHVDEIMFSYGQNHHEIASYRGGVQYLLMGEWTLASDPVIGHFDLRAFEDAWTTELLIPKPKPSLGGIIAQRVTGPGPGGIIHPVTLVRIPYWALILPFGIQLVRESLILVRQLRRRRLGLCRNCGYDLRENSTGQCPECGGQFPSFDLVKNLPVP